MQQGRGSSPVQKHKSAIFLSTTILNKHHELCNRKLLSSKQGIWHYRVAYKISICFNSLKYELPCKFKPSRPNPQRCQSVQNRISKSPTWKHQHINDSKSQHSYPSWKKRPKPQVLPQLCRVTNKRTSCWISGNHCQKPISLSALLYPSQSHAMEN